MIIDMIPLILLKYPFLMNLMIAMFLAMMPLWIMPMEMNLLQLVPYVKNEIVATAPTHDSPIIFLNSPNYTISKKFALIKDYIDGLPFTVAHDNFDECNMHVLASPTCNYYERGTTSPPLYVSNTIELQEIAYTMHWPLLGVHELFFYDMTMHRKTVRLCHCLIYVTLCSLLNYKSLLIKIGFDIPWDPGGFIT